jgi:hypothetical protein
MNLRRVLSEVDDKMTEEDNSSKMDEYFTWEPEKKDNVDFNKYKKDVKVIYFDLDLDNVDLNSEREMWRSVKGLAGILIKDNPQDVDSHSKLYNVKFNGKIKRAIDPSEKDQIINDYNREASRDCMRKLREERGDVNMNGHKYFFPREEFDNKLNSFLKKDDSSEIDEKKIRVIINDIVGKKNFLELEQISILYNNPRWVKIINEFLGKKDYVREGDKYVKIQK